MLWHTMAKELKCEEVRVKAILEVFRQIASSLASAGAICTTPRPHQSAHVQGGYVQDTLRIRSDRTAPHF